MSSLLGGDSGQSGVGFFRSDDVRLWPEDLDHDGLLIEVPLDDQWVLDGFRTGWWPGAVGMDATGNEWNAAIWRDRPEMTRGAEGRLGFTGTIRTPYGTAVAGAVVKLFRTVDDSLVWTTISAVDGTYTLSTPYSDTHYIVGYKDDVIDLAGATPNTLTPS